MPHNNIMVLEKEPISQHESIVPVLLASPMPHTVTLNNVVCSYVAVFDTKAGDVHKTIRIYSPVVTIG